MHFALISCWNVGKLVVLLVYNGDPAIFKINVANFGNNIICFFIASYITLNKFYLVIQVALIKQISEFLTFSCDISFGSGHHLSAIRITFSVVKTLDYDQGFKYI